MQFSLKTILLAISWVAVLLAGITGAINLPLAYSSLPSLLVALMAIAFVTYAFIVALTGNQSERPFSIRAGIASSCFVVLLFLHAPDGPNNQTTLRPIVDFVAGQGSVGSWHSFHIANVVEYWLIPVFGSLGGLLSHRRANACNSDASAG